MLKTALFFLLGMLSLRPLLQSQQFLHQVTTTNQAQFSGTLNNLGCVGNAFNATWNMGAPSWEAGIGSGIEHIYIGGLWVGSRTNGTPRVSTGAQDAASVVFPDMGYEFTSTDSLIRSESNPQSPFYDPAALADQEWRTTFSDTSTTWGGDALPGHTPQGISVDMEAFIWTNTGNHPALSNTAFLNFTITNVSILPLDSVFVGYWVDPVIRNTNISQPGTPGYFTKGGNGYIDSLGLAYEFDATGDTAFTNSYLGLVHLGSKINGGMPTHPKYKRHFNTWQFANPSHPLLFFPNTELAKFSKMSTGLNQISLWPTLEPTLNAPDNRSIMMSAGPFGSLAPGQSLQIGFAILTAPQLDDGQPNEANTVAQRDSLVQVALRAQAWYLANNCLSTGITEAAADFPLTIWPNPAAGEIQLDLGHTPTRKLAIQLVDLAGRVVQETTTAARLTEMRDIAPGFYLVIVRDGEQVVGRKRLVVKR